MKELIQYNYNMSGFTIKKVNNVFFLNYKKNMYVLEEIVDIDMLNNVLTYKNNFPMYEVIYTVKNSLYFEYSSKKFLLYRAVYPDKIINISFMFPILYTNNISKNVEIWEHNIKYFKNEITKLNYSNSCLIDNINYYIGMAENAIYLYKLADKIDEYARVTLSHYRIKVPNINLFYLNPNNIVIDYLPRDIAEYIKSAFFKQQIDVSQCLELINKYNFNYREMYYLFSRILYPNYFFDNINNKEVLENIIKNQKSYQLFIRRLFEQTKTTKFEIVVSWI